MLRSAGVDAVNSADVRVAMKENGVDAEFHRSIAFTWQSGDSAYRPNAVHAVEFSRRAENLLDLTVWSTVRCFYEECS